MKEISPYSILKSRASQIKKDIDRLDDVLTEGSKEGS